MTLLFHIVAHGRGASEFQRWAAKDAIICRLITNKTIPIRG